MYELIFIITIPLLPTKIEHIGSYSFTECRDLSFGEKREEMKKKYPKGNVTGHCIPRSWLKRAIEEGSIKGFGNRRFN